MADRIKELLGEDSFAAASRKLQLAGQRVSAAAIHKWANGGDITEENLRAFCAVYRSNPPYVRYGIGDNLPVEVFALARRIWEMGPAKRDLLIQIFSKNGIDGSSGTDAAVGGAIAPTQDSMAIGIGQEPPPKYTVPPLRRDGPRPRRQPKAKVARRK